MKREQIVEAWKEPGRRVVLASEEPASLPDNPSGIPVTELGESELREIIGGLVIKELVPSTGCVGPVRLTCGIIHCTLTQPTVGAP